MSKLPYAGVNSMPKVGECLQIRANRSLACGFAVPASVAYLNGARTSRGDRKAVRFGGTGVGAYTFAWVQWRWAGGKGGGGACRVRGCHDRQCNLNFNLS